MNSEEYLKKLHVEILVIMDEIDRLCNDLNIKYYLIGGSLLGAVRHKGFIPWDDDLDIAMPREDYERFISNADKLCDKFYLRWHNTENDYWKCFAKVCIKGSVFKETSLKKKYGGIFVDVFPLDFCAGYNSDVQSTSTFIRRLRRALSIKSLGYNGQVKLFPLYIFVKFVSFKKIQKWIRDLSLKCKKDGITHYAMFPSTYAIRKQIFEVSWFGEGVLKQFENRKYRCPVDSESVLSLTYGNYMKLPPIEERATHMPEYVKFSDGMIYSPETT